MISEDDITLIIPAKHESESLPLVLDELKKYKFKKIVVMQENDHETYDAITNYECTVLFQKNNGFGAALIEGVQNAKTTYSCIFNADGSFDPKYISYMLEKLTISKLDFVFNSRYEDGGGSDDDTFLTKIGNFFFTKLSNFLFNLNTTDVLFNYVLGNTKKFQTLNLKCYDFTYCVEIFLNIKKNNFLYSNLPCHERSRLRGFKKVNEFKDGFLILIFILKSFLND